MRRPQRWKEARPADALRRTSTPLSHWVLVGLEEVETWWRRRLAMSRPAGQWGMAMAPSDAIWARRQVARMLRRVRRWIARGELLWP